MKIDSQRAARAVQRIAARLGTNLMKAAAGIIRVANANMERAIRLVSVDRGYDPRDFAPLAFGGCGGLHACEIAEALDIRTVLVPLNAGALSALGMLLCDRVRDYADGVVGRGDVEARFAPLARRARRDLPDAKLRYFADLRYAGQSYELTVPWTNGLPTASFHREHQRVYGYSNRERAVEAVAIRVRARQAVQRPRLTMPAGLGDVECVIGSRRVFVNGRWRSAAVLRRGIAGASPRKGPALIVDYGSTTLVPDGWRVRTDRTGMLILESGPA
jgi:N-methylhydantoinase A/oxoprolinase/acetone carboxylase beta subunit